jgi:hypothetical protein
MKKVCNQPAGIFADRREAEDFSDISIGRTLKSVKRGLGPVLMGFLPPGLINEP